MTRAVRSCAPLHRRAPLLVAAACCLAVGCAEDPVTASRPTTTEGLPSTTAAASTTTDARPPGTSTTTSPEDGPTASAYAGAPPLLLAHGGGIDLWAPGGSVTLYEGTPVAVALPDLMGGVVFQESDELYVLHDTPLPIRWIPAPGAHPVVLVEAARVSDYASPMLLTPVQVVEIDGSPTLLYLRWDELPSDCADDDNECRWGYLRQYLVLRDLVAGTERIAGAVGAWESHAVSFHLGGDRAAVGMSYYGEDASCVGVIDRATLLAGIGQDPPPWIGEGSALTEACVLGPAHGTGRAIAALAPDGSLLAYVEHRHYPETGHRAAPELVLFDPAAGTEVRRLVIGRPGTTPGPMAFDGRWAAVVLYGEQWIPQDPVLIGPAGEVLPLPPGRPSLWQVAAAPRSFFATGADLAASLPLPCERWEVIEDPPPGEHNLYCRTDDAQVGGAVLVPDTTGYYLTHPAQIRDQLGDMLAETPGEACEHFGGGPFLAGVNWWLVGEWDPEDLGAAVRALGAAYVEGIDCSPYLPQE